jgi:hypothetical protein
MTSHHVVWKRRPSVNGNLVVPVIGYRLQWHCTISALGIPVRNKTYGTIVNLLDMISSGHVSRILLSALRGSCQNAHARVIVLLVLLHRQRVHLVLSMQRTFREDLICKISVICVAFPWRVVRCRSCNRRQPARNLRLNVVLLLNYRFYGEYLRFLQ